MREGEMMKNRWKVPKIALLIAIAMVLSVACGTTTATLPTETSDATDPLQTGDTAPDFTLPDSDGNIVGLSTELLDNRLVVLVFYHSFD
jgi:cytochrome oxidase Cu insertion factor (SCO1/SenC/PrrC family)